MTEKKDKGYAGHAFNRMQEAKDDFQHGDNVHLGFGGKGGIGMFGNIHAIHADGSVTVKSRDKHYNGITKKREHKFWKGPRSHLTKNESEEIQECYQLDEVGGALAPILGRAATIAAKTLIRAYRYPGGSHAIKGAAAGLSTAAETVRRKLFSKPDYTTGGGFRTTADGKHYEFNRTNGKTESVEGNKMDEGYASGREAVKKMLDANKEKAEKDKKKIKTYTHFTKDGKRIKVTIPEGYAGGATITHNHGNPARDLTPDTKVSTAHRPGRSTTRPGTATPPSYGTKARDLTKNSNPHTRHRPLTPSRIREGEEENTGRQLSDIISGKPLEEEKRDIIEALAFNRKGRQVNVRIPSKIKQKATLKGNKGYHGHTYDSKGKKVKVYVPTKEDVDVEQETFNALIEMYGMEVKMPDKDTEKLRDLSHHAHEFMYNRSMAEQHHKISGDHEEQYGETHLGKHHYHKSRAHEEMMHHHADHLVKEHGMDRGKLHHLAWKHRDSTQDFALALAKEGHEPLKIRKSRFSRK